MSEWRGLHNPERHYLPGGRSDCAVCRCLPEGQFCEPDNPCRCCGYMEWVSARKLRAEMERLTADRNMWMERAYLPLRERDGLRAEVERLTAELADRDQRIAAALKVCDQRRPDGTPFLTVWAKEVQQALWGESDAS